MLPETLLALIWTLDQSGSFSWAVPVPQTRKQANSVRAKARGQKLMDFSEADGIVAPVEGMRELQERILSRLRSREEEETAGARVLLL
jgi:hypothetical protein